MVLCKPNEVSSPLAKVDGVTVMFKIASPASERLIADQNLLEGGSKSFFLPNPEASLHGYVARSCSLERKNCPVSEV